MNPHLISLFQKYGIVRVQYDYGHEEDKIGNPAAGHRHCQCLFRGGQARSGSDSCAVGLG
jgi:hypothetical protein